MVLKADENINEMIYNFIQFTAVKSVDATRRNSKRFRRNRRRL